VASRFFLAALISLLLGGCWIGDGLYADGDARPALQAGIYRVSARDEPERDIRVTMFPTGMTELADTDGTDIYGFVPLDAQQRTFAAWHNDKDGTDRRLQLYFLGQKQPDGSFTFYLPSCDGAEAEIARRAGAVVEASHSATTCRFTNRAKLEAALQELRPTEQGEMMRLKRVR
jgi:hypothetical protein